MKLLLIMTSVFLATSAFAGADAKNDADANIKAGLAICKRVGAPDDCVKEPWAEFAQKYKDKLLDDDMRTFRLAQFASLQKTMDDLEQVAGALDAEDKEISTAFCSDLFKRFGMSEPFDVCRQYLADMIWDIRTNQGKRISHQLAVRKKEEEKENAARAAAIKRDFSSDRKVEQETNSGPMQTAKEKATEHSN